MGGQCLDGGGQSHDGVDPPTRENPVLMGTITLKKEFE